MYVYIYIYMYIYIYNTIMLELFIFQNALEPQGYL